MDSIHDLGGRHGFGKIDVNEAEVQFHEPFEGRVRASSMRSRRHPTGILTGSDTAVS